MKDLTLLYACNNNGTIGHEGKIPWHLPDDLERYKRLTTGNTQIMGLNTHLSLQHLHPKAVAAYERRLVEVNAQFDREIKKILDDPKAVGKKRRTGSLELKRPAALLAVTKPSDVYTLPNRLTIVVSTTMDPPQIPNPDLLIARSAVEAVNLYAEFGRGSLFVVGGVRIFEEFFDYATRLLITQVNNDFVGDTVYAPKLEDHVWKVAAHLKVSDGDGKLSHAYTSLVRK
jgi:dihydrofolate reductase